MLALRDYKKDTRTKIATGAVTETGLPNSNVLYYELSDNAWCCVRPSGTEPKIKFYIEVKGEMGCRNCFATADAEATEKVEAVKKSLGI